jgi:hypothetical protein
MLIVLLAPPAYTTITRRKLVHRIIIRILNHFGCQLKDFGYLLSKNYNQISLVDEQNNLFMHFLITSLDDQVPANSCNEQSFF